MTDSAAERVVVNFGDVELSDVCLVVGNTDFNVHKMVLASRSSYFKTLFFGDFKEKNEKRITMEEADPAPLQRMLEILYDSCCANEDFFKCSHNFSEVFWKEGVPLWELLDRYDVQVRWKYFENNLNRTACPQETPIYAGRWAAKSGRDFKVVSICPHCVLRKIFTMQHGINLNVSAFDAYSIKTAINTAHETKISIEADILNDLIRSIMHTGVLR